MGVCSISLIAYVKIISFYAKFILYSTNDVKISVFEKKLRYIYVRNSIIHSGMNYSIPFVYRNKFDLT
jgi:predicted ATP-grasp superfamily ATP-dependent carboligase